ncbi:transglutaminase N-terminal domain-containing protein [Massilia sp. 9096]|uniref:transglutaminase N-terminal domain-containing protein n=1 Tax=Massilia sp. 9096 TaxID=1500894 RepID=UPI000691D9E0|nr:transglutaminase N-terminal domain-containing protein [Massilia sp. 9096]
MHLSIRHETLYRHTQPQAYSIEQRHPTPRAGPQQQVLSWKIAAPGHCAPYGDAYGNVSHMLTLSEAHDAVRILVEGVVSTIPLRRGRLQLPEHLSPLIRPMTDACCRLAIGRDYESAAPVRGMRRGSGSGSGEETMRVEALVMPLVVTQQ